METIVFLVGTKYSSNIGAAARAMANFGVKKLILISPQTQIDAFAYQSAAGAQSTLDQCERYSDWEDYFKIYSRPYLLGFSARQSKTTPRTNFIETVESFEGRFPHKVGLVFGSEDNGLAREDIEWLNDVCYLPLDGEFRSLNLSQAVLLSLFILKQTSNKIQTLVEPLDIEESLIKNWLNQLGFNLEAPQKNALITLKKMIRRSRPTLEEKSLFEKVLQQTLRKLL